MESEMEDLTSVKKQMKLQLCDQRDKLKACNKELKKKDQMILDINRVIKNVRIDIHYICEHYQNPIKLKDAVKAS